MLNETIYIGFSARKKWNFLSWFLQKCQRAAYSHVYVRFCSESLKRDLIYQASEMSVHFIGGDRFRDECDIIKEYPLLVSIEAKTKILQFAIDNAGRPYGWIELLGFGWVYLCRIFGRKVKNPLGDKNRSFICSELVANVLLELGYKIPGDLDTIAPVDIDRFLSSL